MQKKLLLLSCIEGGTVMAAELCGARLLAPVFGSSLYVWASVMGITLGALALGYFYGGYLSAKTRLPAKPLFTVLNLAALFVIAMPAIAYYLVPRISYLPFLPGVVASSLLLLFPPVFLLGASSPLFIVLQTKEQHEAGSVSGTVYAVSTAGGIAATFLCGFWLIPSIGLNACLLSFGTLLLLSCVFVARVFKAIYLFAFATLSYLFFQAFFSDQKNLMSSDGLLGRLEVRDVIQPNGDTLRYLSINNIIQTELPLHSAKPARDYLSLVDTLVSQSPDQKNALLLGMGGGLGANILTTKNYRVDAVELDARIVDVAKEFFFLHSTVNVVQDDARYYLNHCEKKYDLVFFDVFKAEEQPGHVLTMQSLERLKNNLTDSARLIINWHGYLGGETGRGTVLLYNTLLKSGFNVKLCSLSNNEDFRNIVMVASLNAMTAIPFELTEKITGSEEVNTDDLPLMERYNALANKKWRANYLHYYQQR